MIIYVIGAFLIIGILIFLIIKNKKEGTKSAENVSEFLFKGPALGNINLYKNNQEQYLKIILANFPKFTKESLFHSINELTNRLINAQNNGYISEMAFKKTARDNILKSIKNMKLVGCFVINYSSGYISVASIFSNNNELYQILMKINIQEAILYLDSYNAIKWFENN